MPRRLGNPQVTSQSDGGRRTLSRRAFSGWHHAAMTLEARFRPKLFRVDEAFSEETAQACTVAEAAHAVEVFRHRSRGDCP